MKKWDKPILVLFIVYLICVIADATGSWPSAKTIFEVTEHVVVLLFVIYLFLTEKLKSSK